MSALLRNAKVINLGPHPKALRTQNFYFPSASRVSFAYLQTPRGVPPGSLSLHIRGIHLES